MVYVLNKEGTPLMPTDRHGKVRHLLKNKMAKVVKREPFTIQLLYATTSYVEELTLGVDSGSKVVGMSVTSEKKEYYCSETVLRNNIVDLLSTKRQNRRTRRNRLRYRQPRFLNRTGSKKKGWLAPSIQNKIDTHLRVVSDVRQILPIAKIICEVASFDIQKIKNLDIQGEEYQQGEQVNFWNVREYVLFRDGHKCVHCKGKSKDPILNVHHIESRKIGGDSPGNLVTVCQTCHNKHHKGEIAIKVKRNKPFKDATFMGIMRWSFYKTLKEYNRDIPVQLTYGYITKNTRIRNELAKTHAMDAFCITRNIKAEKIDFIYLQKKVRCHNRQIHKANLLKGGRKKKNQAPFIVKGFRLFDKTRYEGQEAFITGRRQSGYFALKDIEGNSIHKSASAKRLELIQPRQTVLVQKRAIPHAAYVKVEKTG